MNLTSDYYVYLIGIVVLLLLWLMVSQLRTLLVHEKYDWIRATLCCTHLRLDDELRFDTKKGYYSTISGGGSLALSHSGEQLKYKWGLHVFFAKKKIKPDREVVYESSSISIYKASNFNNIAKEIDSLGTIDRTEFKNSMFIGSHATIEIYVTDELFERLVIDIERLSKNTDGNRDDSVLQFSFNSNHTLIKEQLFDPDKHLHNPSIASVQSIKLTSIRYQVVDHMLPFYFLDRKENTSSEQGRLDRLSEAEFITLRKIQSKYLEWVISNKNIKAINRQKILKQHVQTIDPTIIVLMSDFSLNYLSDKHLITLYKDGSEVTFILSYDEFMNNSDLFRYVAIKIIQNGIDTLYLKIKEASC